MRRVELIRGIIPLGLMQVQELLDEEVQSLAGERYVRGEGYVGYGMGAPGLGAPGRSTLADPGAAGVRRRRRDPAARPCGVAGSGEVDEVLRRRVLYGISCRNDEAAVEAIPGAIDCPVRPGLDPSGGLLVVIDGGEGLRADAPEGPSERRRPCSGASGTSGKRENVVGYLQKGDRSFGEDGCNAPNDRTYAEAHSVLGGLQAELEDRNQSAAASLAEGLEGP